MIARHAATLALIERERRKIELIGVRAALRLGVQARVHAISALRVGASPVQAVRDVLHGNKRLGLLGAGPLIVDGMIVAHLTGRKRTESNVARARPKRLARGAYDEALAFLQRRLELTPDQIEQLREQYQAEALKVVTESSAQLERAIQQRLIETTQQGLGVRDGVKALREAFVAEGYVPGADYRLEATFRTQTSLAYSAGRGNSLKDPAIQEILWGFTYSAIMDDRVRPDHAEMDGVRRPKDDPIWVEWMPPNGWNCRCSVLEEFDEQPSTDVPDVKPDEGFRFDPSRVFTDTIRTAA